jgi:hypothetical protein
MNKKKLQKIYDEAKGEHTYYDFADFCNDAKSYLKDIKKRSVTMSMTVSRSGMTRHFNSLSYNMLLNICYNQKFSWNSVKVGGCGMDMHWNLLFQTCEALLNMYDSHANEKTREKWLDYNTLCSRQPLL